MDAKSVVINLPHLENVYLPKEKKLKNICILSKSHFQVIFPIEFLTEICLINSFLNKFVTSGVIFVGITLFQKLGSSSVFCERQSRTEVAVLPAEIGCKFCRLLFLSLHSSLAVIARVGHCPLGLSALVSPLLLVNYYQ